MTSLSVYLDYPVAADTPLLAKSDQPVLSVTDNISGTWRSKSAKEFESTCAASTERLIVTFIYNDVELHSVSVETWPDWPENKEHQGTLVHYS